MFIVVPINRPDFWTRVITIAIIWLFISKYYVRCYKTFGNNQRLNTAISVISVDLSYRGRYKLDLARATIVSFVFYLIMGTMSFVVINVFVRNHEIPSGWFYIGRKNEKFSTFSTHFCFNYGLDNISTSTIKYLNHRYCWQSKSFSMYPLLNLVPASFSLM